MMKQTLIAATILLASLWSTQSHAAWTKWYNLYSNKDMQQLKNALSSGTNRYIFKRVQCKQQKRAIMIRVDYRSTFEGGGFELKVGWLKDIQPEYKQQNRRGWIAMSRSDVMAGQGVFTCQVWHQSGWG